MQMIIDVNKNIKPKGYKLTLCKKDKTEISILNDAYRIIYSPNFVSVDELEFCVPLYVMDEHKKTRNRNFDLIEGHYLIKMDSDIEKNKYFIIDDIEEETTDDGDKYKRVTCYSREYSLNDKQVIEYKADSRKIYDETNSVDEDGIPWGFMNYIETLTSWTVGYINPKLTGRYRSLNFNRQRLLQVFQDIQQTYGCVFQYDTENKKINIYEIDDLGKDRGLYISDRKYIKSKIKKIKFSEIRTRLYVYGKDNISINEINPTGTSYIENLNFYKTNKYMNNELITALNNYDALLVLKNGEFKDYLSQLETLDSQLTIEINKLYTFQNELKIIQDNIDTKIKAGENYSSLNTQKTNKQNQINQQNNVINSVVNNINAVYVNINNLNEEIKMENNFTQEQLEYLDEFVKYEVYQDSNYTEENIEELYNEAQKILAKLSQPPIEFEINIIDFLNIIEYQHDWSKLVIGDIITIKHDDFGVDIQLRLIGYSHDVDSDNLTLTFSNRDYIDDPNVYIKDLLEKASTTSTQVDYSRFAWSKYDEDDRSKILKFIESDLDATKNKVVAGRNQDIEIGDRGIICRDKDNPNQQVRILNNVIAMTDDDWQTAKLGLTPEGIVAENVYGKLGAFAKIRTDQMIAGDGGDEGTLIDKLLEAENNAKNASVPKGVKFDNSVMIGNGNGIKVLDANNNVRVNMGQYAAGKYGIEIDKGEIYSTTIRSGAKNDVNYIELGSGYSPIRVVRNNKPILRLFENGGEGQIEFGKKDGSPMGVLGAAGNEGRFYIDGGYGGTDSVFFRATNFEYEYGKVYIQDGLRVYNDKNAIITTKNYGERLLHCLEMPEARFEDIGISEVVNGISTIEIDPIFLETLEPHTEKTPFIINITPYDWLDLRVKEINSNYFVVEEKNGLSGKFSWRLSGVRIGYNGRRLDRDDDPSVMDGWENAVDDGVKKELSVQTDGIIEDTWDKNIMIMLDTSIKNELEEIFEEDIYG